MAFDNKSIVRDTTSRMFFSEHGYAFVTEDMDLESHLNLANDRNKSIIPIREISGDRNFNYVGKSYTSGLIPHSILVYDEISNVVPLSILKYPIINDMNTNDSDISNYTKVYVSRLQPTNIKYEPVSTVVYGETLGSSKIQLESSMVEVRSKAEIIIPDVSNYGNMVLTIQKNCFIELKLPDNIIDVIKLPDSLTYSSGYIKGTFTKSGMYTIVIEYSDGRQIIDITVPYYQRLL